MIRRATTMPVYDVMTRAPITVTAVTRVPDLIALFDRHDFNAFPVVDEGGIVRGIVTKLDVLRLLRPDRSLWVPALTGAAAARVEDIMRRGVVCVEAGDPVVVAADLMVETRLRSLPVVQHKAEGPVLVGIVSQGDLLRGLRFELVEANVRALKAGASGYLTKDSAADQLVAAIRRIAGGGAYVTPETAERLALGLDAAIVGPLHSTLSDREMQVFQMIVAGKSVTEIADALSLSVKTVSTHKTRIMQKLNVTNQTELIRYAMRHKLIDDSDDPA